MKKAIFISLIVFGLLLGATILHANPYGSTPDQEGYGPYPGWNYCPYCGSYTGPERMYQGRGMGPGYGHFGRGMGPGYGMGHHGQGMGPGMRHHRGWGMGPQYGPGYQQRQEPMDQEAAREYLRDYLGSSRNPNLKVGKIEEKGRFFEAEIVTKKEGSLVDVLAVDKYTGWVRSIY
jgi:hypothetical protein